MAISQAGFSLGLASTAAFVLSYIAVLTDLNLSAFQTGQEAKKTIAMTPRTTPTIMMIRRFMDVPLFRACLGFVCPFKAGKANNTDLQCNW